MCYTIIPSICNINIDVFYVLFAANGKVQGGGAGNENQGLQQGMGPSFISNQHRHT